jgi:hypothetical protein
MQRLERHGLSAFDRPGEDRNESVARSLEFTLNRLEKWERRYLERLATVANSETVPLKRAEEVWQAPSAPVQGEPRPFTRRHAEFLCQKLSELSLINWDPKAQTISLRDLTRDYLVGGIRGPP